MHSFPAFLVENDFERRCGKKRMVINYKKLNEVTAFDGYYIPNKEQLIELIRGKQWFSSLDCKSGFWQIKLKPECSSLTAFSCPQGQYEWNVIPFGPKQAPGIFQRHMDNILKPFKDFCIVYIDNTNL